MATPLSFLQIARAIRAVDFPACDLVVGIGSGGSVPSSLVAFHLGLPLHMLWYNYRNDSNQVRYLRPRLQCKASLPEGVDHALLVDDVSVSGKTLDAARGHLNGIRVTTLVLKGAADIVLFPEIANCVAWPWKPLSIPNV